MKRQSYDIPPERKRQFDLIELASEMTLRWADSQSIALEHIEPVVPFVETDFSLGAWLFFDSEDRSEQYQSDGTSGAVVTQFRACLTDVDYPAEWLALVTCYFASKEIVDLKFQGSYYLFIR